MPKARKEENRILVLPRSVVDEALKETATSDLLTTDIGYYPNAAWHDKERAEGAKQMIVIYCVSGRGWVRFGTVTQDVGPGQVLVIKPDQPHAYGSSKNAPWTIHWLHAAGRKVEILYSLLTDDGANSIFQIGQDMETVSLFEETFETLRHSYGPDNRLLASLSTGQLLGQLIQLRRQQPETLGTRERVLRTIKHMQQRMASPVSVPDLARMANLSRSQYAALFKRQTGFAVLDFFLRLRMQRAAHLLDTTDQAIKSIAAELGFDDPLYFSRQFHRVYEIAPTQYRRLKKG